MTATPYPQGTPPDPRNDPTPQLADQLAAYAAFDHPPEVGDVLRVVTTNPFVVESAGSLVRSVVVGRQDRAIAWDSFNRANGSLGTSDSGHAWTVQSGTWAISDSQAVSTDSTFDTSAIIDPGVADVDVSADINYSGDTLSGLVFRGIDASNFLFLSVRGGANNSARLLKFDGGVATALATPTIVLPVVGAGHKLRARCTGAKIQCYLDDVRIAEHTLVGGDATKFTTPTRVGFYSGNTGTRWYGSLVVESAARLTSSSPAFAGGVF